MAWFVPLIAAAIQSEGSSSSARMQDESAREQNALQMRLSGQSNEIMNRQWGKEFGLEERKQTEVERENKLQQLKAIFASQPELRSNLIRTWAGRI